MKTLRQLKEEIGKPKWVRPTDADIEHEYKYEYLNHHADYGFRDKEHFASAIKKAKVLHVTPEIDRNIGYRSHTKDFDSLHDMIKGYASYPQFRNEKTLRSLSNRIKSGKPVTYPLLLKQKNGGLKVMGGNTRADLSMQHHGHYDALVLEK